MNIGSAELSLKTLFKVMLHICMRNTTSRSNAIPAETQVYQNYVVKCHFCEQYCENLVCWRP